MATATAAPILPHWFLSRLIEESSQPFAVADFDGRFIYTNRAFRELLGFGEDDPAGLAIDDLTPEPWRATTTRAIERLHATGHAQRYEKEYRHRDGRTIPVAMITDFFRDEHGTPRGYYAFATDMSDRKRAENALIASERRARALFEGIEDVVFVHDRDGRILDVNPAACRRLGYSREELLSMTTREIDDPDFAAGYHERLCRQLAEGHLACEGRHRTKDGRLIPVDINTSTIQLEDQTAVLAVIRDITERKALEETRRQYAESQVKNAHAIAEKNRELSRSEERYRQLTEGSLDAVVVADQDGQINLFNPAAERTFGYTADELIGRPLTILIPEEFQAAHDAGFRRYVATREARLVGRTVELRGRRKDGQEFPLELSLSAVEVGGQLQIIGSIRDQTERQRMRAMLMQTEKLASIGLLSAGVAHEINNPLAYIANNLAVLERDLSGVLAMLDAYGEVDEALGAAAPGALRRVREIREDLDWDYVRGNLGRMISRTREGVQRVANIVGTLRGLARTGPVELESASLVEVVQGALEMVRNRARRGHIEIRVEAADLPKLACVPAQVSQVVLNLLINAVQAVEEAHRADGNEVVIRLQRGNGQQVIEIADNGVGIPTEDLPRLFDPFYTTKPVGEGTGLGLAISHGIITGHGGRIEIQSRAGLGTTFRVFLPERKE